MDKKEIKNILGFDPELSSRFKKHLYSKKSLLGSDSPFSKLLQTMVNQILEGEIESFMSDQASSSGKPNKRNGKTAKQVLTSAGKIYVETPRDRLDEFNPELIQKRERRSNNN